MLRKPSFRSTLCGFLVSSGALVVAAAELHGQKPPVEVKGTWAARNLNLQRGTPAFDIVMELNQNVASIRGIMRFEGSGVTSISPEPLEGRVEADSIFLFNGQGTRTLEGKFERGQLIVRLMNGDQVRRVVMEDRLGPTARPIRFIRQ